MKVEIFNVDHGSCALVTTPNNKHLLMDCGSSGASLLTRWLPGNLLAGRSIYLLDELLISHADEDHVSGMESLYNANITVGWIESNNSLTPQVIRSLKPETPGPGVNLFLQKLSAQNRACSQRGLLSGLPPSPPRLAINKISFRCTYTAYGECTGLNNLSLVTFLSSGGLCMIFPGDIEASGWRVLLRNADFRRHLAGVNVFVASHHGRRSGYFSEVFNHCSPKLVVFSDSSISHDSQNTAALYRQHTSGITFSDNAHRHVLTTRNNGNIIFQATTDSFHATINRA
ncbi:MAG: hypothetical protein OQJ98_02825 [Candidatus Pacebacteria bacterium]|nr:hypothetical protein [Candidatus Paceibacterota bacterium]